MRAGAWFLVAAALAWVSTHNETAVRLLAALGTGVAVCLAFQALDRWAESLEDGW